MKKYSQRGPNKDQILITDASVSHEMPQSQWQGQFFGKEATKL
jgi:hypothetical protein